jgi:hypothetical protein
VILPSGVQVASQVGDVVIEGETKLADW